MRIATIFVLVLLCTGASAGKAKEKCLMDYSPEEKHAAELLATEYNVRAFLRRQTEIVEAIAQYACRKDQNGEALRSDAFANQPEFADYKVAVTTIFRRARIFRLNAMRLFAATFHAFLEEEAERRPSASRYAP